MTRSRGPSIQTIQTIPNHPHNHPAVSLRLSYGYRVHGWYGWFDMKYMYLLGAHADSRFDASRRSRERERTTYPKAANFPESTIQTIHRVASRFHTYIYIRMVTRMVTRRDSRNHPKPSQTIRHDLTQVQGDQL